MAEGITELSNVPKDINPEEVGIVTNPFKKEFVARFDGRDQVFKGGESKTISLPTAVHIAKHMAERIVWDNHEKELIKKATTRVQGTDGKYMETVDEKVLYEERKKAIPEYKQKVWEEMKKIVKTDSTFFEEGKEAGQYHGFKPE